MNILDESIGAGQRQRLANSNIHFRQIGFDLGRAGMKDRNDIIPFLHSRRRSTFFTRDRDFYNPMLCHSRYCLVYLDVYPNEAADYIHRFLRHRAFRTQAQRMGKVIRVRHSGLTFWSAGEPVEHVISW